jgi:hypothetical protein
VSIFETFATDEGIQGVGGFVEVFGATDEGVLVVAGFVDVDGDGDVFSHCSRLTVTSIIDSWRKGQVAKKNKTAERRN